MINKIIIGIIAYIVLIVIMKLSALKRKTKLLENFYKVLLFGFIFGLLCIIILSSLILKEIDSKIDTNMNYDYVIILGAGLEGDQVSQRLRIRLDTAIEIIKEKNIKIIVSGGKGPDEEISEAEAMFRYLIKNGISKNRIIKEDKSTSTQENIKLSDTLMKMDNPNVIIVTSDYHMYRSKMLGKRIGWSVSGKSGINDTNERMKRIIREVFALAKDILIRRY